MSQLIEKIPYVAFYALVIGHAVMLASWMVRILKQIGGFPSSFDDLHAMANRIDKDDMASRAKIYKKHMIILWSACLGVIVLSAITNTLLHR